MTTFSHTNFTQACSAARVLRRALAALLAMVSFVVAAPATADDPKQAPGFVEQVDLRPFGTIALQNDGRIKSLSSFAHEMMGFVSGPRDIAGQDPLFTYLDMLFRPDVYRDADVIYVKGGGPRKRIIDAVLSANTGTPEQQAELVARMKAFEESGLISETLIRRQAVIAVLQEMRKDLIRTAKTVDAITSAIAVKNPQFLLTQLRIVPRGDGDMNQQWHGIADVMFADGTKEPVPGPMLLLAQQTQPPADLSPEKRAAIADAWRALVNAWIAVKPQEVNEAVRRLAAELPSVDSANYPDQARLSWEYWYFQNDHMTRVWLVYMAAAVFLLLGFVWKWRTATWLGFGVFLLAVLLHTFAVMLRWYIADRWPNSNMFEAVTTSAWFGCLGALVIEWFTRKSAMRGLFALGGAVSAMVAMMAAHFLPVQLNPSISNMMPVLHDVWLYIHTNVIIFSYVLIFMAAVSAGIYIVHRWFGGAPAYAKVGGAASLIVTGPHGEQRMVEGRASFGEVLDGVTMVLMEISFVLLWAGIVMGAIWADHSWGRPWGWDPKEVFALNTFLVFLLLVHVRLKAKDKGMWTAWLAIVGAAVMLFNWIVINFVITGLHSYA
jgi:cytochrome c-type biogenesis protein CcsB